MNGPHRITDSTKNYIIISLWHFQEVGQNVLGVHCFEPTLFENVNWDDIKNYISNCDYPDIASTACFAAAKRWCVDQGHSGGIPQSWGSNNVMTVAFYADEFTKVVLQGHSGGIPVT